MVLSVAVVAMFSACVSAKATMLGTGPRHAPVPESEVRVFLAGDPVPGSCQKYALITAEGAASSTDKAQMITAARRRAGKVGANAVQLVDIEDPGTARVIASALLPVGANRKGEMIAYRCD